MNLALLFNVPAPLIALVIFILLIVFNWLGYRFKKKQLLKYPDSEIDNLGSIEGSLLGLMGLFLAFSFGFAASKFETRRTVLIDEANNIGTAILRADLYPDSIRGILRNDFKGYVEARIDYYKAGNNEQLINTSLQKADLSSKKIWKLIMKESQNRDNFVRTGQMVPALNAMIDIVSTREALRKAKVHPVILSILLLLTLNSAFLSGYGSKAKRRNKVMIIGFALMTSLALYLVMELDRPRRGIINLDDDEKNITILIEKLVKNN